MSLPFPMPAVIAGAENQERSASEQPAAAVPPLHSHIGGIGRLGRGRNWASEAVTSFSRLLCDHWLLLLLGLGNISAFGTFLASAVWVILDYKSGVPIDAGAYLWIATSATISCFMVVISVIMVCGRRAMNAVAEDEEETSFELIDVARSRPHRPEPAYLLPPPGVLLLPPPPPPIRQSTTFSTISSFVHGYSEEYEAEREATIAGSESAGTNEEVVEMYSPLQEGSSRPSSAHLLSTPISPTPATSSPIILTPSPTLHSDAYKKKLVDWPAPLRLVPKPSKTSGPPKSTKELRPSRMELYVTGLFGWQTPERAGTSAESEHESTRIERVMIDSAHDNNDEPITPDSQKPDERYASWVSSGNRTWAYADEVSESRPLPRRPVSSPAVISQQRPGDESHDPRPLRTEQSAVLTPPSTPCKKRKRVVDDVGSCGEEDEDEEQEQEQELQQEQTEERPQEQPVQILPYSSTAIRSSGGDFGVFGGELSTILERSSEDHP